MAIPVIPIALVAGVVALARNIHVSPMIQEFEDTLDTVDEGVSLRQSSNKDQINWTCRGIVPLL